MNPSFGCRDDMMAKLVSKFVCCYQVIGAAVVVASNLIWEAFRLGVSKSQCRSMSMLVVVFSCTLMGQLLRT